MRINCSFCFLPHESCGLARFCGGDHAQGQLGKTGVPRRTHESFMFFISRSLKRGVRFSGVPEREVVSVDRTVKQLYCTRAVLVFLFYLVCDGCFGHLPSLLENVAKAVGRGDGQRVAIDIPCTTRLFPSLLQ